MQETPRYVNAGEFHIYATAWRRTTTVLPFYLSITIFTLSNHIDSLAAILSTLVATNFLSYPQKFTLAQYFEVLPRVSNQFILNYYL